MILINDTIIQLIEKIRKCPFLKKYNYILKHTPFIQTEYIEGKGIKIKSISFIDWDEIHINNNSIIFVPEPSHPLFPPPMETLLEYDNWEELYKILSINTNNADEDELLPFICVCGKKFKQLASKCRQINYPNGEIYCYAKCPRCGKEPETRWK